MKIRKVAKMPPELTVHPAADLFPMLGEEELADLAESIKANGLRYPIVIDGSIVIDGRNRLAACKLAGVEPIFEDLGERDPLAFIASANINRRFLTKGQQAMAYAFLYPEPEKVGRKKKGTGNGSETEPLFSKVRLSQARQVLAFSPEVGEQVFAGEGDGAADGPPPK